MSSSCPSAPDQRWNWWPLILDESHTKTQLRRGRGRTDQYANTILSFTFSSHTFEVSQLDASPPIITRKNPVPDARVTSSSRFANIFVRRPLRQHLLRVLDADPLAVQEAGHGGAEGRLADVVRRIRGRRQVAARDLVLALPTRRRAAQRREGARRGPLFCSPGRPPRRAPAGARSPPQSPGSTPSRSGAPGTPGRSPSCGRTRSPTPATARRHSAQIPTARVRSFAALLDAPPG